MKNFPKVPILIAAIIGVVIIVTIGVVYLASSQPTMLQSVTDKINSIITPKAPIGTLTPARDLRGVWKSSLTGKGLQLYGKFDLPGTVTDIYEEGDIELIINDVVDNIAYGTMRYTNICAWGTTTVTIPGEERVFPVPKTCYSNQEYGDVQIKISSSALDFGTISSDGITTTMQGTYTSDLMSGSMTMTYLPYGVIKGEFKLSRQQ
ncbi:MAG: hypothetical protein WC570_04225 [Patescibacteria group bacterium]